MTEGDGNKEEEDDDEKEEDDDEKEGAPMYPYLEAKVQILKEKLEREGKNQ